MNNGNRQDPPQFPYNILLPFQRNDSVLTPEMYARQMSYLQHMRSILSAQEQQINQGYLKYIEEKQKLEAEVERGALAKQRLDELESAYGTEAASLGPVAGPSTSIRPLYLAQDQPQASSAYDEIPSTARIVEVSSSTQASPQPTERSSVGSFPPRNGSFQSQGQTPVSNAYSVHHSHASSSASYTATAPGMSTSQPTQGVYTPTFSAFHPDSHPQQQAYQSGSWMQGAQQAHQHRLQGRHFQNYVPPIFQAPPMEQTLASHQWASSDASSSYPPRPLGQQESSPNMRKPLHEPVLGTRGKVLPSGAQIVQTACGTGESAQRAKVTYSTKSNSRSGQPVASHRVQPSEATVDSADERTLVRVFQSLDPGLAANMVVHVLAIIERKQKGGNMSVAEEERNKMLPEQDRHTCELISERLKQYALPEVTSVLSRVLTSLKRDREQAQMYTANVGNVSIGQPQQHPRQNPTIPAPSSMLPPVPRLPQPGMQQLPPQSPAIPPVIVLEPPADASSAAAPTVLSASPSAAGTRRVVNAADLTQAQWYGFQNPGAPIAFRNTQGQMQFMSSPLASIPKTGVTAPPVSVSTSASTSSKAASETERKPPSPWSPEKADRSRLASDIIRSLGRPRGAFGAPLMPSAFAPPFEMIERSAENSKRPASSEPSAPPTPSKRPRLLDEDKPEHKPEAIASISSSAVFGVTPASAGKEQHTPANIAFEPFHAEPHFVDEYVESFGQRPEHPPRLPEVLHVETGRAESITSSEAADVDRVQAMFASEPESLPSAPSSPAARPNSANIPFPTRRPSIVPDGIPPPLDGIPAEAQNDVASHGMDTNAAEVSAVSPLPSSYPSSTEASRATAPPTSPPPPTSPQRGKEERLPLFLPSPSSSSGVSVHSGAPEGDVDMRPDSSLPLRRLSKWKGKERARDVYVNIDLTSPHDEDEASLTSPRRPSRQPYVLAPPLPPYASRLVVKRTQSESSVDELAEWSGTVVEERSAEEIEANAAVELSHSRLRVTPCLWYGCGAVLNSSCTLEKHVTQHASEHEEYGIFFCRWQNCLSNKFSDKAHLLRHLSKHARIPFRCAYEGCVLWFYTPHDLLHHHNWTKHRDGKLRESYLPAPPVETRRPLSPLPDIVPAYMSVTLRVGKHPISKERHQWLGPKVLENITSFKYSGRRSNAALPSRGSRRLAEKVATAELTNMNPDGALRQIKRWIDDEYLDFADGYDASRRQGLWCGDLPSGEVTKMVDDGLVLAYDDLGEDNLRVADVVGANPPEGDGSGGSEHEDHDPPADVSGTGGEPEPLATSSVVTAGGASGAPGSTLDADSLAMTRNAPGSDVKTPTGQGLDIGGRKALTIRLPRRTDAKIPPSRTENMTVTPNVAEPPPPQDQQWRVWPPAKEESVGS